MTKRIILLVSILLMLVNVCVSAESKNYDYERLYNLNIVDDSYEAYMTKKVVSHKEMIAALIGIVTDEEIADDKILEYALSRSIISDIGSIDVDTAISYERALSLTLNTLGYSKVIAYSGNDIDAVMKYANENKLTKGITLNKGDFLDGASMITLLANAIEADVLNVVLSDKIGSFEKSDKTPLEAYREIEEIIGQITHTGDTSLYKEDGAGEKKIGIDDVIYDIGYTCSEELLGQTVIAFVKDDVVFHVEPKYDDIKRVEIEGRLIRTISDDFTEMRYEDGRKIKDIDLNPALTVIYNGKNYEAYTKADLMPATGKVVLMDYDRDKKIDIVFVYDYETIVVKNVSTMYRIIGNVYDLPESTKTLDFSDTSEDIRIYSNGQEAKLTSIAVNNVLSVARSMGEDPMTTIYIGKEKINGTVAEIDEEDGTVTVGETKYKLNSTYIDAANAPDSKIEKLSLRKVYDFYIDAFGEIAYVKSDKLDGYEYALFLKQRWDDSTGEVRIRLLNINDEWEFVYFAEKVNLNERGRKAAEEIFNELGGNEMLPQVVLMKKDSEGKILAIKQPEISEVHKPDSFTKTKEWSRYYWTGDSSFNCRHYLKYDAIILLKPNNDEDKYDEEQYEFATVGYFSDWKQYKYVAYNVDEFGYPDLFEVRDTQRTSSVTLYVNKIGYSLNEDEEPVKSITGNISGIENLTLYEIPGAITTTVKPGDIADVKLRNGKISDLTVSYSAGGSRAYTLPVDDYHVHDGGTKVMGDIVGIDVERSMLLVDCKTEVLPVYIQSKAEIEIFNEEDEAYVIGTLSDLYEGNYVRIEMGNNQVYSVVAFH